jgi:parvulin-like peptidyl-prolyl isomerase
MLRFFVLFFSLLFVLPSLFGGALTIDEKEYSLFSFYSRYPKKQWERADSLQKNKMYSDFVNRELCILEAKRLGLQNDPKTAVKIRNRSLQALVNESYESFVAKPLIPETELRLARKNVKRELFINHILIAYRGAYIKNPPKRTLDEALLLAKKIKEEFDSGEDFVVLAEKHSDDPGVEKNAGSLGWVRWGETVPLFQTAAFDMEKGVLSGPVLTDFGYHLILVSDEQPSEFQGFSESAYEEYVINISKKHIRDRLRSAAIKYDSEKLDEYGVFFNEAAISEVLKGYNSSKNSGVLSGSSDLLSSLRGFKVLAIYNEKGFGPKWFASRLSRVPSNRQPQFKSTEDIKSVFKTIILQDIAVAEGRAAGVDSSFIYKQKSSAMVSDLLHDAYLKHIVNSVDVPKKDEVEKYYNNNISEYLNEEKIVIRDIRVSKRVLADSLLIIANSDYDFALLAQEYSSINPTEGGLVLPFTKKDNPFIYSSVKGLLVGEISGVVRVGEEGFSIIKLINRLPGSPKSFDLVYNKIESLIINEKRSVIKTKNSKMLLNKYAVVLGESLNF